MSQALAQSLSYIRVPITAILNGVSYNPTGDVVQFAVLARNTTPTSGTTWTTGSWEGAPGPPWVARVLVGPGGSINPGAGSYRVFVKITDSPEIPVLDGGDLLII